MANYIFTCILLSLISALLYHASHSALRDSVRSAMGVVLLLFMVSPLGALFSGAFNIKIPQYDFSQNGAYKEVTEEAYCMGIAAALSEEFSLPRECFSVYSEGFDFDKMYSDNIHVTLTGRAAFIDYRAVRSFVLGAVDTGGCEVEIEID